MQDDPITNPETLRIVEVFRTIIGESRYCGYPCTLVRLAGCNLRCNYCDTVYAQEDFTYEEHIFDTGQKIKDEWVLITGGEPLDQDAVYGLINLLVNRGKKVLVETNGSKDISKLPEAVFKILDLKTPSSGMNDKMNFDNLKYLNEHDEVKFVIADDDDFKYAMKLVDDYDMLDICTVSFSPAYDTIGSDELADAIIRTMKPIRLNLQIHKMIGIK